MGKIKDLTGKVYSRLTVIEFHGRTEKGPYWKCRCSCGAEKIIHQYCLASGGTKSCGCLLKDPYNSNHFVHGEAHKTKEWACWTSMKQRCLDKRKQNYPRYGGRGIKICKRWLSSYVNFLSDMGRAPSPSHTLDRLNNDDHYKPSNCRWATKEEQANNTCSTVRIVYKGIEKPLTQWCKELNLKPVTIRSRIKSGYSVEEAFEIPRYKWKNKK